MSPDRENAYVQRAFFNDGTAEGGEQVLKSYQFDYARRDAALEISQFMQSRMNLMKKGNGTSEKDPPAALEVMINWMGLFPPFNNSDEGIDRLYGHQNEGVFIRGGALLVVFVAHQDDVCASAGSDCASQFTIERLGEMLTYQQIYREGPPVAIATFGRSGSRPGEGTYSLNLMANPSYDQGAGTFDLNTIGQDTQSLREAMKTVGENAVEIFTRSEKWSLRE
jgi:hypothetical protein